MTEANRSDAQVLVVGAGPVGLTAAYELARRGVRVRVVDRATGPAATSRAASERLSLSSSPCEMDRSSVTRAGFDACSRRLRRRISGIVRSSMVL